MQTLAEAKTELKKKGYSIRTIYTPNEDKIYIHILKGHDTVNWCKDYTDNCEEYLIEVNKKLK
jgi:hypothetical protein